MNTIVTGRNAMLKPAAAGPLFKLAAGRSLDAVIGLDGISVDCTGVAGVTGVEINDHYGAVLRDVYVLHPATGVLITDTAGWSECSQFGNAKIDGSTSVGIDAVKTGGTGSFGYANRGFVHVLNVPSGAIGLHSGAGTGFSNSTIGRLVIHSTSDTAVGWEIAGNVGQSTSINATLESLASGMGNATRSRATPPAPSTDWSSIWNIIRGTAQPAGTAVG